MRVNRKCAIFRCIKNDACKVLIINVLNLKIPKFTKIKSP